MEVHLMTEMMSGVEHAKDATPETRLTALEGLDERLIDQLVGWDRPAPVG